MPSLRFRLRFAERCLRLLLSSFVNLLLTKEDKRRRKKTKERLILLFLRSARPFSSSLLLESSIPSLRETRRSEVTSLTDERKTLRDVAPRRKEPYRCAQRSESNKRF
uniref:Uncharacterized protein n=1 Tax=Pseudopediastrum sp. CL0201VA TaxID=2184484 RepID=A0A2U8GKW2_9CHLO|nr:hypothetical protein [Pseudopediastrum sp. CL0201VA]AWI68921.1 hypothetical protein [Pseudopediastrum sp. CL0201VA]